MKNKLTDLNNHLFAQLERLNDEDPDIDMETEIKKAKVMATVGGVVVNVASLALKAEQMKQSGEMLSIPKLLE